MGALGFSDDNIVQYCLKRTRGWMIAGWSTEILKKSDCRRNFWAKILAEAKNHTPENAMTIDQGQALVLRTSCTDWRVQ